MHVVALRVPPEAGLACPEMAKTTSIQRSATCSNMSTGEVNLDKRSPHVPDYAAIVFLSQRARIGPMMNAIRNLDRHVRQKFNYSVVVFWDDFEKEDFENIRKGSDYPIHFEKVDFNSVKCNEAGVNPHQSRFPLGYRQMCRFWTFPVMRTTLLEKAKYFWRIDTDAKITAPVQKDPFKEMEANKHVYGVRHWLANGNDCRHGSLLKDLDRLSRCFLDKHPVASSNQGAYLHKYVDRQGHWTKCWGFETNFEIVDTQFFGSQAAEDYFNLIDSTGGFLRYRWGDAHTRSETLALLGDRKRIKCFGEIGYQHKTHQFPRKACQIPASMDAIPKYGSR